MKFIHKSFLKNEVKQWEKDGIITDEQVEKILAIYNIKSDENSSILTLLAYLFFGLSLLVLVGANWQEIPELVRICLLILLNIVVGFAGHFWHKKGNENYSAGLFFLATLIFCSSIALVSQMYHINRYYPDGLLLCVIGAFIPSLVYKNSVLTGFMLMFSTFWALADMYYKGSLSMLYLLFITAGIYVFIKRGGRFLSYAIFISIYCFIIFRDILFFDYTSYALIFVTLSYAFLTIVLSRFICFEKNRHFYQIAFFISCLMLIFLQFSSDYVFLEYSFSLYFMSVFVVFCILSIAISAYFKNLILVLFGLVLLILPFAVVHIGFMGAIFSIISVIVGAYLVKQDELFAGFSLILITAIIRYIELVGDYIGASVLFLVCAVIMRFIAKKGK